MSIENIIKKTHLKLTNARMEILNLLQEAKKPTCYEEMKDKISMDKATFYRNILKFEEDGIINSFELSDKKRYYELQESPHSHFVCTNCNTIECIKKRFVIDLPNYKIEDIVLKGLCPNCK